MRKIARVLACILISAPAYGQGVIPGEYGAAITSSAETSGLTGTYGLIMIPTNTVPGTYASAPPPCAEPTQPVEDDGSYFTHQHYHQKEPVK
jgi:hypothetical protein